MECQFRFNLIDVTTIPQSPADFRNAIKPIFYFHSFTNYSFLKLYLKNKFVFVLYCKRKPWFVGDFN